MKKRIEELALDLGTRLGVHEKYENSVLNSALTKFANENLEMAAKECASRTEGFASKSTWDYAVLECAKAIRGLKI